MVFLKSSLMELDALKRINTKKLLNFFFTLSLNSPIFPNTHLGVGPGTFSSLNTEYVFFRYLHNLGKEKKYIKWRGMFLKVTYVKKTSLLIYFFYKKYFYFLYLSEEKPNIKRRRILPI